MALKLMYITNRTDIALIAQKAGVDRIFVDLEYIGKTDRQGGMDTVQSKHTLEDVKNIAQVLTTSELLVRINPIHEETNEYLGSQKEINKAIENGADILMLPYFKSAQEVRKFVSFVNKRVKTMLLVETIQAVECLDEILSIDGIDSIHIGLNDLSLGYGKQFMFELLTDGTVEKLCSKFREKNIPYGFGGIASLGKGTIPAEMIIKEHYRLGSVCAILSRSFCNVDKIKDMDVINSTFINGMRAIRDFECECEKCKDSFLANKREIEKAVKNIVNEEIK